MFQTFKLFFGVNFLAFFAWRLFELLFEKLGYFLKNWAIFSYLLVTLISVPFQWRFFTIFCRRGVTNCQRVHLPSTTTTTSSTTTTKEVFQHQLQKWSPKRRTDPTVAAIRRRAVIHGKKSFEKPLEKT